MALAPVVSLGPWPALAALAVFIPVSHAGARFWHFLLYRPPVENYPRIIRVQTRLREWRACHVPSAHWQHWLNFEDYFY